ncbi:hypothetical protein ZYGR_0AZ01400 [Zygosaccharomyces rouxii]|uniref:N-acetylglucosaminylphosphatidylinositol deacetylase n=1 Tax=Zygosaccharomyces rouxii TaxID=4956 RepID=A0A1Q3AJQ5_ZYGRO|nr:hypothetical protein ZYGR_0AZ01400 [Zygosaccharomyces rouxii]
MWLPKVYFVLWVLFITFSARIKSRNEAVFNSNLKFLDEIDSLSLVVAHPDDEVMFFAPTILELDSRLPRNVEFNVVCLSKGGADGLGDTRVQELKESVNLLLANSKRQFQLQQYDYPDGHEETWDQKRVQLTIKDSVLKGRQSNVLLTFDDKGVSTHVNHIACHEAVSNLLQTESSVKAVLYLDSYGDNIVLKYSAFFWEVWKLTRDWLLHRTLPASHHNENKAFTDITLMNDYSSYVLSFAAMLHSHKSQMVWFRYGWWTFSRFVFVNDLKMVNK